MFHLERNSDDSFGDGAGQNERNPHRKCGEKEVDNYKLQQQMDSAVSDMG